MMSRYNSPLEVPAAMLLSRMTAREASAWSMEASSQSAENDRRAQVICFYGLTSAEEVALYESVLDED